MAADMVPSTVRETARIARWASDITARRGRGEKVPAEELLDYQRAKVALLADVEARERTNEAFEVLADAHAQLAAMEARRARLASASTAGARRPSASSGRTSTAARCAPSAGGASGTTTTTRS